MSVVIQCNEEEIMDLITVINDIKRMNIRFTFYIVKHLNVENKCSFKTKDGSLIYYKTCYVINELRNLAIETIQTSHFIIVDGDGLISCNYFDKMLPLATMEDNLKSYIPLLSNEKEILLFPLFQFSSEYHKVCRYKGQCKEAYFIFSM